MQKHNVVLASANKTYQAIGKTNKALVARLAVPANPVAVCIFKLHALRPSSTVIALGESLENMVAVLDFALIWKRNTTEAAG